MSDPFGLDARPPLTMKLIANPDRRKLVAEERVDEVPEPTYVVVGRTRCYHCDKWCHLDSRCLAIVERGEAIPICIQCCPEVTDTARGPISRPL